MLHNRYNQKSENGDDSPEVVDEQVDIGMSLEERQIEKQAEQAKVFYSVNPNDKDRDGVSDEKEVELGTSDFEFDTDGDGLSDKLEIETYKTDPTNTDTDGDGFWDGLEVVRGFNPLGEGVLE